jgi:sugar/nucleoside kinase (ribokinase family)
LSINFLAIGPITHDLVPNGFRFGGTVSFASATARRLGWHPGILTRVAPDGLVHGPSPVGPVDVIGPDDSPLAGTPIHLLPSDTSTTFSNIYRNGVRTQVLAAQAEPVTPADLPAAWTDVPVVLLGPLAQDVPASWTAVFPHALMGVTPQGWMRRWDAEGHVSPTRWENAASFLHRADVAILSREDVGGDDAYIAELATLARLLVITDGWHGATLYMGGASHRVPPRPTSEVDPTGAGDVFATAFLLRLAETGDPFIAARFANVTASMSVEAPGMDSIPYRDRVEEWLARNP